MSKTKDLAGATFRALGVSGLVASLSLAASGCVPLAVGAGAYAGTKIAQKGGSSDDLVESFNAKVCYNENGKEGCVCGGNLYRNSSAGYYLLKGFDPNQSIIEEDKNWNCSNGVTCDVCLGSYDSRVFSFSAYKDLRHSIWLDSGKKPDSSSRGQINLEILDEGYRKNLIDWGVERGLGETDLPFEEWKARKEGEKTNSE